MKQFIACAICLNIKGKRIPMTTMVRGYAVCADHVNLVANPQFDIFSIRPRKGVV